MIIGRNKSVDKSVNQRSTQRVNGRDPNKQKISVLRMQYHVVCPIFSQIIPDLIGLESNILHFVVA